jgi:Uma2 family endonuclease
MVINQIGKGVQWLLYSRGTERSKMSTQTTLISAEELLRLCGDGKRCELVAGEVIEMAPAGRLHGRTAATIALILGPFIRDNDLGEFYAAETGFIISREPDTVRAPDVAFVAKHRLPSGVVGSGFLEMVPDLVVEVVSPGDSASYVQEKAEMWLKAGAQLVWVVYPVPQSVVVYHSQGEARVLHTDDEIDGTPVFEDFKVAVEDFFR